MHNITQANTISLVNIVRLSWILTALLLLGACIAVGVVQGWAATGVIVAAALLPDVALIGAFAEEGRLRPERVRFYNLLHAPILAIAMLSAGAVLVIATGANTVLLVGAAWLTHIAVDRACGFGLREPDGSIRPVGIPRRVHA